MHKLKGVGLNYYITEFKNQPITNNCGTLKGGDADENSLVFDVSKCSKAWIRYYQVKKIDSVEEVANSKLVDLSVSSESLDGYKDNKLILNKYIGMFFNMQRGRLSIYGRKNFIALVNHHLFMTGNNPGIIKENFLFDVFPTTLTDKTAMIASVIPVSVTGLIIQNTGIVAPEALPEEIIIDNPGEKREFSLGEVAEEFTFKVRSTKPFDRLTIIGNDILQEQADTTTNSVTLTLTPGFNLFDGINTYVIHGMGEASDVTVATINVYYRAPYVISKDAALKVVYYSGDPLIVKLVEKIRTFLGWE